MLGARGDAAPRTNRLASAACRENLSPTTTRLKRGCMPLQHHAAITNRRRLNATEKPGGPLAGGQQRLHEQE